MVGRGDRSDHRRQRARRPRPASRPPPQINLSWSAPGSTGGSAITGYKIEVSANGTSGWTDLVANTNGTGTAYAHTGLTAGDTRHYRAPSTPTAPATRPTSPTPPRTPACPAPRPASRPPPAGPPQINLSWSAPGSTGGSAITGYKIEVSANGTSGWTDLVANTSNTTTAYAHTGLTAGDTRHYRVSAINTNGTGDRPTSQRHHRTPACPAPRPASRPPPAGPPRSTSPGAPRAAPAAPPSPAKIEVSANGTSGWTDLVANTSNTTTTYAHTGLTAGDTRHYRVSAINTNGTGDPSNVANATTARQRARRPDRPHGHRQRGHRRSTSPGAPRAAPAAPPSPVTRSRSRPTAPPAGPTSSPTPTAPAPPTRTPG